MSDGTEAISKDEILYRRIPKSTGWYQPETKKIFPEAFRPTGSDSDGLSLSRAKYSTVEEAGRGRPGKSYWVAELRAKDLIEKEIRISPTPIPGDRGHCVLPDLTHAVRRNDDAESLQLMLRNLVVKVHGPHDTLPST